MQRLQENEVLEDRDTSTEEAFTDAGFSVERIGKATVLYEREVSHDVVEASKLFSRKTRIGYIDPDRYSKNT